MNNECGVIRECLSDLIENVYVFDKDYVDLEITQNALRSLEVYYHRCPNKIVIKIIPMLILLNMIHRQTKCKKFQI